jgi:photosystem II stability/assembly factor-like uncharacterized protein
MAKVAAVFIEDARYVGIWPSYVESLRLLVKALGNGDLYVIDQTPDGWYDDGASEVTRYPLTAYNPGPIRELVPLGHTLVAVEDSGTDLSPTIKHLYGTGFRNKNIGFRCGQDGRMVRTEDGGVSFVMQTSGTGVDLYDVSHPAALFAYSCGQSGTIVATSDDGDNWNPQTSGTAQHLRAIHFPHDEEVGYVVGEAGTILKTTDLGVTWSAQTSGTVEHLRGVYFLDNEQDGWAVGDAGTILATEDGGTTWVAQTSGTANDLYDVEFKDGNTGWAVGELGTILKTTDGGTTWVAQTSGVAVILQSVSVRSSTKVWACGMADTILATADGGTTWNTQTSPLSGKDLYAISFHYDDNQGITCGESGAVLRTVDAGVTWTQPSPGTKVALSAFSHPDNAMYVFGPHNGLHKDFIQPDYHVYIDGLTGNPDVRDAVTMVLLDRFDQHPSEP